MARTSVSHPLRIDSVAVPGGGRIGMTLCPGKRQEAGLTGAWARDLDLDLAAIGTWGATALVSVMEEDEFRTLGVPGLGELAEDRGLAWYHLAVPDGGVPDAAFEATWAYAGQRLRTLLRGGGRIVVHCKGGLGRTGTVAARLLVELGAGADEAMAAIRAARPGAIETHGQERYLRTWARRPAEDGFADRVFGCLLGGAVGDAFGYAVEFVSLAGMRRIYGRQGIRAPVHDRGRLLVSDDTQMTLFTVEGLLAALEWDGGEWSAVIERVRRAYLDWHATQQGGHPPKGAGGLLAHPALWAARAPGRTCLIALAEGGCGRPDAPINDSKGCGGVMRVAPMGLVRRWDHHAAFLLAVRAAAITHTHPTGYLAAGALALIIRLAVDGLSLRDAAIAALAELRSCPGGGETADAVAHALALAAAAGPDHPRAVASLGEGWVAEEALAIGLYAALAGHGFPEVLAIAANHDGDSDSTASIAGQLYGARHGLADLPHAWVRRLDVLEPAMDLVTRLAGA